MDLATALAQEGESTQMPMRSDPATYPISYFHFHTIEHFTRDAISPMLALEPSSFDFEFEFVWTQGFLAAGPNSPVVLDSLINTGDVFHYDEALSR